MKKRLRKHYFNMVEIALALAVLAIGLSSILVLFPVGVNANRSAIANNNLAVIAEYVMGYLRAGCMAKWIAEASGETPPNFLGDTLPARPTYDKKSDDKGADLDEDCKTKITDSGNLFLYGDKKNEFIFKQMSGDTVDFAAVIKVWEDDFNEMRVPWVDAGGNFVYTDFTKPTGFDNYAKAFCVEISWPAQAPWEQREKRIFRQEFFNEYFTVP